ncbi:RHS repeat protein [Paucibacter sp. O1-1]|nr:RHS repeat protein [Paucibacter sp. O1-1]MDA3824937.1 RHS repeat protein [Paucibacter sp. O1-1]
METTWSYDRADNRLSEKVVSRGATNSTVERSYSYDARNQLRSIADSAAGTITLSYDAQGNLTQKAKGGDTTTYAWNARDLLSNVSRNGTVLGNYSSDHAGLRVSKEAMNPAAAWRAPAPAAHAVGRAKRTAGSRRGRCCADALRLRPGPAGGAVERRGRPATAACRRAGLHRGHHGRRWQPQERDPVRRLGQSRRAAGPER